MTERLTDLNARIETMGQLSVVVAALRAAAGARAAEARARIEGMQAYAQTIARAIGVLLGQEGATAPSAPAEQVAPVVIVLGAEQGFVGAFNTRILQAAAPLLAQPGADLLMLGSRAGTAALELGCAPVWQASMPSRADQAAAAANRLFDALGERLQARAGAAVHLIHAQTADSGEVEIRTLRLLPVDFTSLSPSPSSAPPLLMAPPAELFAQLAEEYVFARLCEAIVLSFGAESEARMRAMAGAQQHIGDMREDLVGQARRVRQEEITAEIVDLSTNALR